MTRPDNCHVPFLMKFALQTLVLLPLIALCGCMSYSSRIELHPADSWRWAGNAGEVEREVDNTLGNLGYQRDPVKDWARMKEVRPGFVAEWVRDKNHGAWTRFWWGPEDTRVQMTESFGSISLNIDTIDTGDRQSVEQTQRALQKMAEEKFPGVKVEASFRPYFNFPAP
jgi:hypothetical protein